MGNGVLPNLAAALWKLDLLTHTSNFVSRHPPSQTVNDSVCAIPAGTGLRVHVRWEWTRVPARNGHLDARCTVKNGNSPFDQER